MFTWTAIVNEIVNVSVIENSLSNRHFGVASHAAYAPRATADRHRRRRMRERSRRRECRERRSVDSGATAASSGMVPLRHHAAAARGVHVHADVVVLVQTGAHVCHMDGRCHCHSDVCTACVHGHACEGGRASAPVDSPEMSIVLGTCTVVARVHVDVGGGVGVSGVSVWVAPEHRYRSAPLGAIANGGGRRGRRSDFGDWALYKII